MWDIENNVSIGAKPVEGANQKKRKTSSHKTRVTEQPSNHDTPRKLDKNEVHWEEGITADPEELAKEKLLKLIEKSTKGFPLFGKCCGLNGNGPYGAYYGKRRTGEVHPQCASTNFGRNQLQERPTKKQ